jgi:hypothetical protein
MSYRVTIKDTKTGETVTSLQNFEWSDGSLYWWTEGNFGCDCNRNMQFQRAKGIKEENIEDIKCGDDRFFIEKAIFESGLEIEIDGSLEEESK